MRSPLLENTVAVTKKLGRTPLQRGVVTTLVVQIKGKQTMMGTYHE
jgi:hypothetical protein